ncbi:MAG: hypothetical protein WC998_01425 [Candidatus Paceibacterota bacterium]|jgi:hypothetical protein
MKNKVICEIEGVVIEQKPMLEVDWRALSRIGIYATNKQQKKIKKLLKRGKILKAQKLILKIIDDWERHQFEYIKEENRRRGIKGQ